MTYPLTTKLDHVTGEKKDNESEHMGKVKK